MVLAHDFESGPRTQDVQISQDISFENMLLTSQTLKGLNESGFYKPSPVQLHGVPLGKCGFDLLLEAKSGTGKTAVFTIIALEKLELNKGLQTVILTPTREIAAQICDVIKQIGSQFKGLVVEVVMGGLPVKEDIDKFKTKNVHMVVASPGRLKHLMQDGHIDVSAVRLLVLDEADKLMEKNFQSDINFINSLLPNQKQIIMSSATYPEIVKPFIKKFVPNGQHVCPDSSCVLLGVQQKVTVVRHNVNIVKQTHYRFEEVLKILSKKQFKQCLIFCNYQARVVELRKMLIKAKWPAEQLYGNQEQTDRLDALKTLQEYKCRILIATDLAARGIDASNVDLIINFEPPFEWQTYLHRIGRAGRYGSYGEAVTILGKGKEENKFYHLLKSLKVSINNFWQDNATDTSNKTERDESNSYIVPETQTTETNWNNKNTVAQMQTAELYSEQSNKTAIKSKRKDYGALWNVLTCKSENPEDLESFESLCTSFTELTSTKAGETPAAVLESIETFSDLLCSFQSHKNDSDVKIDAKTNTYDLRAKILSTVECFSHVDIKEEDTLISQSNKQEPNINGKNVIKTKYTECDINNQNNCTTFDVKPENATSQNNSNDDYPKAHETRVEYVFETIDDELAKAGLPTAFGSTRNRKTNNNKGRIKLNNIKGLKQTPKSNHNENTNYMQIEKEIFHGSKVMPKSKEPTGPKSLNRSSKINVVTASSSSNEDDTKSSESESSSSENESSDSCDYDSSEISDNIYSNVNNQNCHIHSQHYKRPSQSYIKWYNQLKVYVKQIEQAVFVDELSKL